MSQAAERGSPADWLRHATSHLLLAEATPAPGVLLESLVFHAQQAAEKALKAVLLHLTREEPPFTHSLTRLLYVLAVHEQDVPLSHAAAEALTRYALLARYPTGLEAVGEAEWQQAVADARAVVTWAQRIVAEEAGR
jgi:HEPN domain-containing protein